MHGDEPSEVTPDQFCRFLVDSPLIRETIGGTVVRPKKPASGHEAASRSAWVVDDDAMEVTLISTFFFSFKGLLQLLLSGHWQSACPYSIGLHLSCERLWLVGSACREMRITIRAETCAEERVVTRVRMIRCPLCFSVASVLSDVTILLLGTRLTLRLFLLTPSTPKTRRPVKWYI